MLPDKKLGSNGQHLWNAQVERRRESERVLVDGEALVVWSPASATPVRYRVLDQSAGGLRIQSALPLKVGAIGTVVSMLPAGQRLNREFQVMWCRKANGSDPQATTGYEAGIRFATS